MSEAKRIGVIRDINGPIVTIELSGVRSGEQVKIGELGLFGEVISLRGNQAVVQTYESTDGVRPGEPAVGLGWPLSVELGPGLMGGIFDGVQRPLAKIALESGDYIRRGISVPALDRSQAVGVRAQQGAGGRRHASGRGPCSVPSRRRRPSCIASWCHRASRASSSEIAPAGNYDIESTIARVRDPRARCIASASITAGRCASPAPT